MHKAMELIFPKEIHDSTSCYPSSAPRGLYELLYRLATAYADMINANRVECTNADAHVNLGLFYAVLRLVNLEEASQVLLWSSLITAMSVDSDDNNTRL